MMFLRVSYFFILFLLITSCDKLSFLKNNNTQVLDTIVNFSSVDTSPSFKECDSIIDQQKKSDCFRTTIHQKIGVALKKYEFSIKNSISETVYVDLLINSKGKIILETIESSQNMKIQLPKLDSILRLSIARVPNMYPAIKRGIPVTTKYRLPILIQLKE
jgi:hypothetical protein|tara:strand:+ start:854 stop:1333 length:480 start_codon:yes stop_codon:yes gene_type:complete